MSADPKDGEQDKSLLKKAVNAWNSLFQPSFQVSVPVAIFSWLVGSVALTGAVFVALVYLVPEPEITEPSSSVVEDVALFEHILRDIDSGYVEKVSTEQLFETGVRAMLGSLDPYTEFENNKAAENLQIQTFGTYGGVGLGLSEDWKIGSDGRERETKSFRVMNALEGYAYDAGLRTGDHIFQVDDVKLEGKTIADVTSLLRGKPGSDVRVAFYRDGVEKPGEIILHRDQVHINDVALAMRIGPWADSIGYIQLKGFAADAGREVKNALLQLKESSTDGKLKAVVLDLRGNPGGLLTSAVDVAEQFVPRGSVIVTTKGRDGPVWSYTSQRDPVLDPSTRVIVLTDRRTASAAEIVAGAIQDHDRGLIVGEKTFGKGLVQQVAHLPYDTSLKFTVAKYYTPSGRCIQSVQYREGGELGSLDGSKASEGKSYVSREVKDGERKTFKTSKGRLVRDGGGVEPDLMIPAPSQSEIELQLVEQGAYLNFASKWAVEHPDLINEKLIWQDNDIVTPQVFDEFVRYISDKKESGFELRTRFDGAIRELSEAVSLGGFPKLKTELDGLQDLAHSELLIHIMEHRDLISQRIEDALRARCEPETVRIAHALRHDQYVSKATEIAMNPRAYDSFLSEGVAIAPATQDHKTILGKKQLSASARRANGHYM